MARKLKATCFSTSLTSCQVASIFKHSGTFRTVKQRLTTTNMGFVSPTSVDHVHEGHTDENPASEGRECGRQSSHVHGQRHRYVPKLCFLLRRNSNQCSATAAPSHSDSVDGVATNVPRPSKGQREPPPRVSKMTWQETLDAQKAAKEKEEGLVKEI